jgi:hypothetical protein
MIHSAESSPFPHKNLFPRGADFNWNGKDPLLFFFFAGRDDLRAPRNVDGQQKRKSLPLGR